MAFVKVQPVEKEIKNRIAKYHINLSASGTNIDWIRAARLIESDPKEFAELDAQATYHKQ